jgi:hypothetical protein
MTYVYVIGLALWKIRYAKNGEANITLQTPIHKYCWGRQLAVCAEFSFFNRYNKICACLPLGNEQTNLWIIQRDWNRNNKYYCISKEYESELEGITFNTRNIYTIIVGKSVRNPTTGRSVSGRILLKEKCILGSSVL